MVVLADEPAATWKSLEPPPEICSLPQQGRLILAPDVKLLKFSEYGNTVITSQAVVTVIALLYSLAESESVGSHHAATRTL